MSVAELIPSSLERFGVTARSFAHHTVASPLHLDVADIGTTLHATTSSDAQKEKQR
jgi:hypothetical protein